MSCHILGAGAIGLRFADKLLQQGVDVSLVLRDQAQLEAYQKVGSRIQVFSHSGLDEWSVPATLPTDADPIAQLLVTTKAFEAEEALTSVAHRLTPDSEIVLLLNGYGVQQRIAHSHSQLAIWAASTTEGANRNQSFTTRLAGEGLTQIGALSDSANGYPSGWENLNNLNLSSSIDEVLWRKLAINCCINPLTVLFDCQNGGLVTLPEARELLLDVAEEIEQVSGYLSKPLFEQSLAEQALYVAQQTGTNISSMLQDHHAQRRTEMGQITQAFIDIAKSAGLDTPVASELQIRLNALGVLR